MPIYPFLPLFCNCRRADVEAGAGAGGTASGAATGGAGGLGEESWEGSRLRWVFLNLEGLREPRDIWELQGYYDISPKDLYV